MKTNYVALELKLIVFAQEDVIRTSGPITGGDMTNDDFTFNGSFPSGWGEQQ